MLYILYKYTLYIYVYYTDIQIQSRNCKYVILRRRRFIWFARQKKIQIQNKLNKRQGSPNRNHKACINLGYPMFHAYISYLQVIMARQRLEIIEKIGQNELNVLGNIKVIYNQKK